MNEAREAIEGGLTLYRELVESRSPLVEEFEHSQREFFAAGTAERLDQSMAARRHLEWFLLERPSDHLGGVPAEALKDEWAERAGDLELQLSGAFLQSLSGAFEVTSSELERGLWIRDLFGLGEYPIEEAEAALELRPGDLLVGRIFPVEDGMFRLSPAVSCFRNPELVSAVRDDLERMRAARRGVLRIQQIELERLFFSAGHAEPVQADAPRIDIDAERTLARSKLLKAGVSPQLVEEILDEVRASAREGRSIVTEVLNELAFSTDADLEGAREALAELWAVETHACERGSSISTQQNDTTESDDTSEADVRAALAAFDEGRANGEDLDALFNKLAGDLGVEAPTDDGIETAPPDFPGVIGAMVEEFLWDVGREQGGHHAERMSGLRRLAKYGERIGMFEEFTKREVLDFAGRWLLDEGDLNGPEEARAVLDALREFCAWSEERHGFDLRSQCDDMLGALVSSVPRLTLARKQCAGAKPVDSPWNVGSVENEDRVTLLSDDGRVEIVQLDGGLTSLLREGDLLHARRDPDATWQVSKCYPTELRELLDRDA